MGYGHVTERIGLAVGATGLAPRAVPVPLLDTYYAAMGARVVMAATSLGVLAVLDGTPRTAADVARLCGVEEAGADVLLVALHALGYVRARDGGFELSGSARRWLSADSPQRLEGVVGAFVPLAWDHLSSLEERLAGAPKLGIHERPPDDPYWDRYQRAMLELAALSGPAVARAIPVRRPRRLLDLGGGPGGHAMAMCRRHLDLRATIVELEGAARRGRAHVADAGMADRIEYRVGDVLEADLGAGYDVATCHNLLHMLAPERCVALLRRARGALRPGGTIAVLELERPPPGRRGSRIATLLGVLFHLLEATRTYTADELAGWFREAGFARVRTRHPSTLPGSVVVLGRAPLFAPREG